MQQAAFQRLTDNNLQKFLNAKILDQKSWWWKFCLSLLDIKRAGGTGGWWWSGILFCALSSSRLLSLTIFPIFSHFEIKFPTELELYIHQQCFRAFLQLKTCGNTTLVKKLNLLLVTGRSKRGPVSSCRKLVSSKAIQVQSKVHLSDINTSCQAVFFLIIFHHPTGLFWSFGRLKKDNSLFLNLRLITSL